MLDKRVVRVRFRKDQPAQPIWVFIGKVFHFSTDWLGVEGKGVLVFRREAIPQEQRTLKGQRMVTDTSKEETMVPATVDEELRSLLFPRETIANVRILPETFDLDSIRVRSTDAEL